MHIHIRIVAPAFPLSFISSEIQSGAERILRTLGYEFSYGRNVRATNDGSLVSIERRAQDIHDALRDPRVTHLMSVIGGIDSHKLLPAIDWNLWRQYPKPLIGYSDITSLQNAALKMADVVSVHGPAFATLGQPSYLEFSIKEFVTCLSAQPYLLGVASYWIDDEWYLDLKSRRDAHANPGYSVLRRGSGTGQVIGGNLTALLSLVNTIYLPSLEGKILFLEDTSTVSKETFSNMLDQLFALPHARSLQGVVFGRMQTQSELSDSDIRHLLHKLPEFVPVLAKANFGHTYPVGSFPIGRVATVYASKSKQSVRIT